MKRLDILLTERGLATSRTHAQRLIKEGLVSLKDGQRLTKPSIKLDIDCALNITDDLQSQFVSRGALKLLGAIETFNIDVSNKIAIDVGQSTGGFTDCLLQHNAAHVVGIEVGHSQLADKLKSDPRVTCYEKTNARDLPHAQLLSHTEGGNGYDLAVMDVSFISQTKILPSLVTIIREAGLLITLVKPQFEVGSAGLDKNGIVKDTSLFAGVEQSISALCTELGMKVRHYIESPIKGGDGNREFLLIAEREKG